MISVVCATIGRPSTWSTLEPFFEVPEVQEIIIVLPPLDGNVLEIPSKILNNLKVLIIYSQSKGQVFQRVTGIRASICEHVLLIDDDISIERSSVISLIERYQDLSSSCNNVCLAPKLYFNNYPKALSDRAPFGVSLVQIILVLLDKVLLTGSSKYGHLLFYFPISHKSTLTQGINFLPGALLLTQKRLLPHFSYYPWPGKAYCEDVFLSSFMKSMGSQLFIEDTIFASTSYERRTTGECFVTFLRIFIHSLLRADTCRAIYLLFIFPFLFAIFCIYIIYLLFSSRKTASF